MQIMLPFGSIGMVKRAGIGAIFDFSGTGGSNRWRCDRSGYE